MPRTRNGNPSIAIAYLRVSTEDQKLGPEAQRAQIEAWAQRENVTVLAWHVDAGVSGGSEIADRPALLSALSALRAAGAGVFVVAKRDRLARDSYVALTIERAAAAAGAKVASADGNGNGDSPADAFMRAVLDGAAAYERALIRERTKAALQAKKARGERIGNVPYGFAAGPTGALVPNVAEQGVIECVRELRAAGLSLRAIEAELAKRGILSRTGKHPLDLHQIAKLAKVAA